MDQFALDITGTICQTIVTLALIVIGAIVIDNIFHFVSFLLSRNDDYECPECVRERLSKRLDEEPLPPEWLTHGQPDEVGR